MARSVFSHIIFSFFVCVIGMSSYGLASETADVMVLGNDVTIIKGIKLRLKVNPLLTFIKNENEQKSTHDIERNTVKTRVLYNVIYYASVADADKERKILVFTYSTFKNPRWTFADDLSERPESDTVITKGKQGLGGEGFDYIIYISEGYIVKTSAKILGVTGNRKLSIDYIESLPKDIANVNWSNLDSYTAEQHTFIKRFAQNALESFGEE